MTERQVTCEECGGDGGFDVPTGQYDHNDGSLYTRWDQCRNCNGDGWYVVDDEAMTMEDALALDEQKLRDLGAIP